ncbi:EamA family transporter RarD [[Micrococcus luteus] ATCC 49442]|uniref:EamA family transporter RarD n=1 Tax=[Micrococcus luteus] ATCC 49442 TaxID=2698727 RepID=UPI0013D9C88A|nr:EamA family transporter RarD [[Micrococcus luteus] ATCC 49442]
MSVKQKAPTAVLGARAIPSGLLYGLGAYGLWGLLPLYFTILVPAGPIEIVASRVIFSVVVCALLVALSRSWKALRSAFLSPKVLAALVLAAVLISINWLTYTYGVISGRAVEASLGYFINPLVSVLLGVLVFKERLRPMQWVAVSLGGAAVFVLTASYGQLPWIALTLACSFGSYGLVKKKIGGLVDAATSLTAETLILAPLAVTVMCALAAHQRLTIFENGPTHFWLLASGGLITAVPLLFFGAAARRLPMTTIGLLQYTTPILQFTIAITVLDERLSTERWIGFGVVWLALLALSADSIHHRWLVKNRRC